MTVKGSMLRGTVHLNRAADKTAGLGRDLAQNVGNSRVWQATAEKANKFRGPLLAGGLIVGSVVAANAFMGRHREAALSQDHGQGQQR